MIQRLKALSTLLLKKESILATTSKPKEVYSKQKGLKSQKGIATLKRIF